MISNIAAAITLEYFHAAGSQRIARGNYVFFFCIAAKSNYRRMLEQQQHVADCASFTPLNQCALKFEGLGVRDNAKLQYTDPFFSLGGTYPGGKAEFSPKK